MYPKNFTLTIAAFLLLFFKADSQTIDRGPYLQLVTANSIFIHWRTDTSTDTKVWYGTSPNNLTDSLYSSSSIKDHEINITGLNPNSFYYYAVGDSNGQMVGGDNDHYFKTAPTSNEPIRVWVLGDAGKRNDDQAAVRDAYYNYVGNNHIDMMLLLGDNAYADGTQAHYQEAWFESAYGYPDRLINSVMWSTFGNHDGVSSDSGTETGPYYEIFNFPKNAEAGGVASGTEAYYSFDYGNMHIICLNSHDIDASAGSPMIQWLEDDVNANTKDWLIAMFHHPAYKSSITPLETNALPLLEDAGCDLVLVGHNHRYERSWCINGHYGTPSQFDPATMNIDDGDGKIDGDGAYTKNLGGPGTVYVTTGSAGSASSGNNAHPIMHLSAGVLGSVELLVDDNQMDLKFIDSNGNIEDYFTIIKADGPPNVDITNPLNNTFYPAPETINITATANDNGSINQVEFFIDNVSIGTDFNPPYSQDWTMPGNGSYEIKATATDNDNLTASKTVVVMVGEVTVCAEVNSSNDDVEEDATGGMSMTSSDLELIQESTDQTIGLRFTGLNIPQGAFINSAFIQFTCDVPDNINPCNLTIYAEQSDDAATFSNINYNVTSRTKTNASVVWSPVDWLSAGDAGPAQKTVDISPLIQEVVDRPGFDIGSSIAIIIEGTGKREAESFNGTAAPEICIEYSVGGPLPIELLTFTAKNVRDEVELSWTTASELNNNYFLLERSADGRSFEYIATMSGNGTTLQQSNYHFMDTKPEFGINYYRLKQVDYDGKFTYSDIVNTQIVDNKEVRVYPSKVKDVFTIEKSKKIKDALTIKVFDLNGNLHLQSEIPADEFKKELSVVNLTSGAYFVTVYYGEAMKNFKIIKL